MFALVGVVWIVLCAAFFGNLSILPVCGIGMILLEASVRKEPMVLKKRMALAFSVAMVLMLIQYFGLAAQYGQPYYRGTSDDFQYESQARYLVERGVYTISGMLDHSRFASHNSRGFVLILSHLMRLCDALGGYHTIVPRVLNLQLLQGIAVLTYRYYLKAVKNNRKEALLAYSFLAFFPNAIFISAFIFRDALNMFLLFSVFYCWNISWRRSVSGRVLTVLVTLVALSMGYWLRTQNLFIIGAIVMISLVLSSEKIARRGRLKLALLLILMIAAVSAFGLWDMVQNVSTRYSENYRIRSDSALSRIVFSTPLLPYGIVLRMVYAIVSPIPLPILETLQMFGSAETMMDVLVAYGSVAQILLLPYLGKNLKKLDGVTVLFIILWGMIACTTFNFRHFLMIYPLMAIMISRAYAEASAAERRKYPVIMLAAMMVCALIYLVIS